MLELRILEPSWISGEADDADDPCAHGTVMLAVDGKALITPADEIGRASCRERVF